MQINILRRLPERPILSHHQIDVWCWTIEQAASLNQNWKSWLLKSEQLRMNRFCYAEDRHSYVVTRGMVRYLLGCYLRQEPSDLFLTGDSHDALYLHESDLCFGFANTREVITIAVARQIDLGVQVEAMIDIPHLDELAHFMLDSAEIKRYSNLHHQQKLQTFYQMWTRKSALFKAAKTPTTYLSQLNAWEDDTIHCDAPNAKLYVKSLDLMPSYSGAIAYRLPVI